MYLPTASSGHRPGKPLDRITRARITGPARLTGLYINKDTTMKICYTLLLTCFTLSVTAQTKNDTLSVHGSFIIKKKGGNYLLFKDGVWTPLKGYYDFVADASRKEEIGRQYFLTEI